MKNEKYQKYINNFRRRLARHLRPGIGISCDIFPSEDGGAILEFKLGDGLENDDRYQALSPSIGTALTKVNQRAFSGNFGSMRFGGTSTLLEPNRIIYIKESNPNEWNDDAAQRDIEKLLSNSKRAEK